LEVIIRIAIISICWPSIRWMPQILERLRAAQG
jgi:hypothetical protein